MSIPSQCVSAAGQFPAMVSDLEETRCVMRPLVRTAALEGPLWLWLGAIGPLPISAERRNSTTFEVRFHEPLDPRIVDHFGPCEDRAREDAPAFRQEILAHES